MILKKIKNDGLKNTLINCLKILSSLFYRTTYTVMLRRDKTSEETISDTRVTRLDLQQYKHLNLLNLPISKFKKWDAQKAITLVLEVDGSIAGYVVIHFVDYLVTGLGCIDLEEKKAAWIGPIFVAIEYRGKGVNSALINSALSLCFEKQRVPYTSTNIENIPSIRTFEKFGFQIVQIFKSKYLFSKLTIKKVLKRDV